MNKTRTRQFRPEEIELESMKIKYGIGLAEDNVIVATTANGRETRFSALSRALVKPPKWKKSAQEGPPHFTAKKPPLNPKATDRPS
jgi:hypothetical protein